MTAPRVCGVDLSLASTGLADSDGNVHRYQTRPGKVRGLADDLDRIECIADAITWFAFRVDSPPADLAVIEGPSLGQSRQAGEHMRAGCWWHVVEALWSHNGVPVLVVPPAVLKTYATGVGNAAKDAVLAAAIRRYPAWDITGNDVADAVVLCAVGARLLGHPIEESLPKTHARALLKLALPVSPTP